ncbi:preprotein translocase subunit SecG [Helicobacter pylori]
MTSALLGLQIVLAVLIVVVVLLQKSSSIGLGAYSGSNESLFGAKGPASFMAKLTMFLGLLFVANTIALGYFYNKEYGKSILDETKTNKELSPLVPATGTLNPTLNPLEQAPTNPLMPKQTPNELPKEPAKASFIESPKQNEKNDAKKENKENKENNNIKGVEKTKENAKTPPTTHQKPKTHATQTNAHTNQKKDEK